MITELDICRGIIEGALPSPTPWPNSSYVALRLSGTGVAYRPSLNEYVYRSPDIWLSAEMQRRLLGAPIIIEHAPGGLMTSRYFGERCVGFVAASYVNNDEHSLWGIARILDSNAIKIIEAWLFDTSPAILLPPGKSARANVGDQTCLVESEPLFIDHVALVYMGQGNKGVWSRDDGPGVQVDQEPQHDAAYDYAT
jgi:hypothetical protein